MRSCECEISNDSYMGSGIRIKNAVKKYGVDSFTKTILEIHESRKKLIEAEIRIIDHDFLSRPDVYNIAMGGLGGDKWTHNTSDVAKERHRIACEKNNKSPEFREILRKSSLIRNTDEHKQHLSNKAKDNLKDPEFRKRYDDGIKNRVFPDTWLKSIRDCKQTSEYKELRSEIAMNYPIYECEFCGKRIKSKGNLTQHLNARNRRGHCL